MRTKNNLSVTRFLEKIFKMDIADNLYVNI